ncbi:class I SAM-dependent methyltransferase [Candidatus Beckwithbacteria bacterium]|nr:class I SAM-dependent methyltransferase [Candidatus Beckwithbacteria bacterium]
MTIIKDKNSYTRNQWLKKTLAKIPKNHKILDAGAGQLQFKKYCKHLKYTSQDFGEYDGKGDNKGLQTKTWDNSKIDIKSDIIKIPVQDKSFDVIMCTEVLEHLPEPIKAIKEFSRILKSNGKLIITAPFCSLTHFTPYYFYNGFSKYWYEKILPQNGFIIEEVSFNGNFFDYLSQEICRIPYMASKYSKINIIQNIFYRLVNFILLKILNNLSKNSKNSEEMLCFGLHILATKK